jgi:hypothetical protein
MTAADKTTRQKPGTAGRWHPAPRKRVIHPMRQEFTNRQRAPVTLPKLKWLERQEQKP